MWRPGFSISSREARKDGGPSRVFLRTCALRDVGCRGMAEGAGVNRTLKTAVASMSGLVILLLMCSCAPSQADSMDGHGRGAP